MPHGSSQVVGLIEIDEAIHLSRLDRPSRSLSRSDRSFTASECEIVQANFAQINADLRRELAQFVARLAAQRARRS